MTSLGNYLKQLRKQQDRSRRWVERQTRILYPDDRKRQISHSYLRQIEEGLRERLHPLKLQSLAEVYGIDYKKLLEVAGYLESDIELDEQVESSEQEETAFIDHPDNTPSSKQEAFIDGLSPKIENTQQIKIKLWRKTAVQAQLVLTTGVPQGQRAEIQKRQLDRLFDLVGEIPGQQHP